MNNFFSFEDDKSWNPITDFGNAPAYAYNPQLMGSRTSLEVAGSPVGSPVGNSNGSMNSGGRAPKQSAVAKFINTVTRGKALYDKGKDAYEKITQGNPDTSINYDNIIPSSQQPSASDIMGGNNGLLSSFPSINPLYSSIPNISGSALLAGSNGMLDAMGGVSPIMGAYTEPSGAALMAGDNGMLSALDGGMMGDVGFGNVAGGIGLGLSVYDMINNGPSMGNMGGAMSGIAGLAGSSAAALPVGLTAMAASYLRGLHKDTPDFKNVNPSEYQPFMKDDNYTYIQTPGHSGIMRYNQVTNSWEVPGDALYAGDSNSARVESWDVGSYADDGTPNYITLVNKEWNTLPAYQNEGQYYIHPMGSDWSDYYNLNDLNQTLGMDVQTGKTANFLMGIYGDILGRTMTPTQYEEKMASQPSLESRFAQNRLEDVQAMVSAAETSTTGYVDPLLAEALEGRQAQVNWLRENPDFAGI